MIGNTVISDKSSALSFEMVSLSDSTGSRQSQQPLLGDSVSLSKTASVAQSLKSLDPGLADDFMLIIEMLRKVSPESVDRFVESVEAALGGMGEGGQAPADIQMPTDPSSFSAQAMAFRFTFEAQGTDSEGNQFRIEFSAEGFVVSMQREEQADPVVLDLDGNGFTTTGVGRGVRFDINNDGTKDVVSMPLYDGIMAMDHNRDGIIDRGSELFGDQAGHDNGFAALAEYDDNGDGWIDEQDRAYDKIRVVRYTGDSSDFLVSKSMSLEDAGVASVRTAGVKTVSRQLGYGDSVAMDSVYTKDDGSRSLVSDLMLIYRPGLSTSKLLAQA